MWAGLRSSVLLILQVVLMSSPTCLGQDTAVSTNLKRQYHKRVLMPHTHVLAYLPPAHHHAGNVYNLKGQQNETFITSFILKLIHVLSPRPGMVVYIL
jgi:hypothetical protein